jgi:porin
MRIQLATVGCSLFLALSVTSASAEEDATLFPVPDYSGDLWSRSKATGDWGGLRSDLASHGAQLEVDFNQVVQGVAEGGLNEGTDYTGSFDYVLKLDTGKMGLWPGGFILVRGETLFGDLVNGRTGSLLAPNADALFPVPGEDKSTLTDVAFVQFLAEWLAVTVGRLSTLDGCANDFAHGRGTDQFMNLGNVINPVTLRTVPYTALGAGIIVVPSEDIFWNFMALDAEGDPTKSGFDTVFKGGTVLASELRIAVDFGLPGHLLIAGTWSSRNFVSLEQDPRFLFNFLPRVMVPIEREGDSWSVYYNFDQYVWKPDEKSDRGIGLYGRFGFADEDTSPIDWFVGAGLAAKGLIPGRDADQLGVGFFHSSASSGTLPRILQLGDETGVELYYNFAATGWLNVTADLQVIEPALRGVDTSIVLGLRMKMEF